MKLFIGIVGFVLFSVSSANAGVVLTKKNLLSLSLGGYQFKVGSGSFGSIGLAQLNFKRAIGPSLSAEVGFENGLSVSSRLSSLFWGFDLGAAYSFGTGFAQLTEVSDVVRVNEDRRFGVFAGAGLSIRAIPLSAGTITYSGVYAAVQPVYRITEDLIVLVRGQFGVLYNGSNRLVPITGSAGLGFSF